MGRGTPRNCSTLIAVSRFYLAGSTAMAPTVPHGSLDGFGRTRTPGNGTCTSGLAIDGDSAPAIGPYSPERNRLLSIRTFRIPR
jgi:hypothetical protein